MSTSAKREKIEPGLYRAHTKACPLAADNPGRRCSCPFHLIVPGSAPGKSRTVTHPGPLTEARREKRRLQADGRSAAPARRPEAPTLFEFVRDQFLPTVRETHALGVADERALHYRIRIDKRLGHLPLTDITPALVRAWFVDMTRAASSHRMVSATLTTLRVILDDARRLGLIAKNPAAGLRTPRANQTRADRVRVLDEQQMKALLAGCSRTLRAETMLRMALEGGLRRGEVIGLRWGDVDLGLRTVWVRRGVRQERGRASRTGGVARRIETAPKSGRDRVVHIQPQFAERLAAWYEESVIENGASATGYVWPGRDGRPMGERTPNQVLERSLARAGLVDAEGRPLVTFHELRHTCASILLSGNVPLPIVSAHLGHANPRITAEIYSHVVAKADMVRPAEAFEAVLGDAHSAR